MSSQKSRVHETHETMARVLLAQRTSSAFERGDIGAIRQAQGRQAHFGLPGASVVGSSQSATGGVAGSSQSAAGGIAK